MREDCGNVELRLLATELVADSVGNETAAPKEYTNHEKKSKNHKTVEHSTSL